MATTTASSGASAALLPLAGLAKGFSAIAGFNGIVSVRSRRAAGTTTATSSTALFSTSRGMQCRTTMTGKDRHSGREKMTLWDPSNPYRNIALIAKNARRMPTRAVSNRQESNLPQQSETGPLWVWMCLALYRAVTDALRFLWEQPGQLMEIEWPSLQSTIRMAALTVVVVAFFIVFLATIDSTFSYVLASMLRRVP